MRRRILDCLKGLPCGQGHKLRRFDLMLEMFEGYTIHSVLKFQKRERGWRIEG